MKKIIIFIIFLFLIKVVVVKAAGSVWYQVQDGGVRANVIKNTIDSTKAFSVGINSDNGFVMGETIECAGCKFGSPTNDWRVDGSKIKKPEIVTWGKMKELESRLPKVDRDQFCFFEGHDENYRQSDFISSKPCKFFVIAGKAIIKSDVNSIVGALIVVPSKEKAYVEFEDGGSQQLVITGMLYSAGDIKFKRSSGAGGEAGVKVIYDPSFIFNSTLKNVFMDLTNWKQGI